MSVSSASSSINSMSSLDVASYQESLESVLAWLLEAEETLQKQDHIAGDVQKVKQQFHEHEVSVTSNERWPPRENDKSFWHRSGNGCDISY